MLIADVPAHVRELALRLAYGAASSAEGLPAYVYDLGALDTHAAAIRAALPPGTEFYYAAKANPDPEVLRVLARHVDGFEVSSAGEAAHVAGAVPGGRMAFGGPGKTAAAIDAAIRGWAVRGGTVRAGPGAGMPRFHVESPRELRLLAAAARAAGRDVDVLLRVNLPADDPGDAPLVMGGGPSQFGMDPELLDECADLLPAAFPAAAAPEVRVRGLHAHLASGLDADALVASAVRLLAFGREWCARHGVDRPEFGLGGGMRVDYTRPDARFDWAAYGRGLAALACEGETLRIEPGRAVTAYCGWYVTRVLDVKRSQGQTFAVVEGGTHHLRTPAAKGHSQPFAIIRTGPDRMRPERTAPGRARSGHAGSGTGPVTIVGQLCTPRDVLARDQEIAPPRAGDLVVFGLAGAYAWNISHHSFLMHTPPSFHYLGPTAGSRPMWRSTARRTSESSDRSNCRADSRGMA